MFVRKIRRFLRLKPPYYSARHRLYEAVKSGRLEKTAALIDSVESIRQITGWGPETSWFPWGDLETRAERLGIKLETLRDLLELLETIDLQYS